MTPDHLGPTDAPDRFALVRRLGGGSMGVVYEAYDRAIDCRVALKTLAHGESRFLANLKREFRLVQNVIHPNLVRLGGLFQGVDTWFFTMELLEGSGYLMWVGNSCADAIATERWAGSTTVPALQSVVGAAPVSVTGCALERVQQTVPQLGAALAALHAEGLVHRDVKPSNVLVTSEGRVVVLDFGLARADGDEAHGWTLAGTPAYMAPEQGIDGTVTAAADCYAVGVMLYQALTGRLPFVGALADLIHRKRSWSPVAPSLLAPGIPADLEALCLGLLAPQPGARPSAAEIAAWRSGSTARARHPVNVPAAEVFVGRAHELERIRVALTAAGAGSAVVVVNGESGIGKTALLRQAARRWAGEGSLVLRGRCFEHEVTAYPGVDMVMDALVGHLRKLDERAAYFAPRHAAALRQIFPTLAAVGGFAECDAPSPAGRGYEMRLRATGAFHELFARLATRYQVVLAIDDAQWLTEESLVLLRSLLATDDPVPLVLLFAARGPDLGLLAPWLETLACPVTRLSLGPLSPAESLELLRQHLTGRDDAELETMVQDSAGHPYLLRELALATDERITSQARVDDVLRDRAVRLAPLERTVLDVVCAATAPIRQRVVGAAAGIGPGDLAAITAVLVRQRWVVVTPGGRDGSIWPAHDRIRGALRAALDGDERQALARRLAEAIEASAGDDVESLALQWCESGDLSRAARFARLAGDRAMEKLAFERAVGLYDLALRGIESDAERAAILTTMADALAGAGRGSDAAMTYLRAAEVVGSLASDDLVLRAADQLIRSGEVAEGKQLLSRVLDRLGLRLPGSPAATVRRVVLRRLALYLRGRGVRGGILAIGRWRSWLGRRPASQRVPRALSDEQRRIIVRRIDACWAVGDLITVVNPLRAAALHLQGLSLAYDAGDPYRLARSLCMDAILIAQPGRPKGLVALARLADAEQICKRVGSLQLEGYLAMGRGAVELLVGELDRAQHNLDRAETTFERCPGAYWEIGVARELALRVLSYRGRVPELAQRLTAAVALCTTRGDRIGAFRLLTGPGRLVLLSRDQPDQLLEACRMEPLGLSPDDYSFPAFCALFGRVNALLYLGRAKDALAALDAAHREITAGRLLYCQVNRVELIYLRGRAALARASECPAAEHASLIAMTRGCVRTLRRERVAWACALARALDAGLALLTISRSEAITGLRDAASQLAAAELGGYANAVQWQLQHVLGVSAGDPWQGVSIVHPDRLAHTFAPLPVY